MENSDERSFKIAITSLAFWDIELVDLIEDIHVFVGYIHNINPYSVLCEVNPKRMLAQHQFLM